MHQFGFEPRVALRRWSQQGPVKFVWSFEDSLVRGTFGREDQGNAWPTLTQSKVAARFMTDS